MQQFKNSVLDEDGLSVRAMSDESVRELADQAAEGILEVVSTDRQLKDKSCRRAPTNGP